MSKVSVIIPTYNVEPYLHQCLDSVTRQTLQDIEIICVNDGSTDRSLEIIQEYANRDSRIVVITGPNGGYGKAMNKGLEVATGEYIGIVEPDDYISYVMYEDLYEIAQTHNLDFVKADFYRFSTEDNGDLHCVYNHLAKNKGFYNKVIKPMDEKESFRFIMNTWSGIYKRDFINSNQIRHNETPGASFQDNGFWFQTFLLAERAMFIDRPYYMNRRDNPNSSVKAKDKVYAMNEEYKYLKNLISQRYPKLWDEIKYVHTLKRIHNYNFTLTRIDSEMAEQYIKDCSKELRQAELLGEIDKNVLSSGEWKTLQAIKNNPEQFFEDYKKTQKGIQPVIQVSNVGKSSHSTKQRENKVSVQDSSQVAKLQKRIKDMENSNSWKVGRFMTYPIRKLKSIMGE